MSTLQRFMATALERLAVVGQPPNITVASGLLGAAAVVYFLHSLLRWYRLSHVPGPFWAAFSKYWMVRESLKGRQPTALKEVTDKYGRFRFVRMGLSQRRLTRRSRINRTGWT